jgi:hypothetical protein
MRAHQYDGTNSVGASADFAVAVAWAFLLLGTVINVQVPVPGSSRLINFALFDLVLPVCLLVFRKRLCLRLISVKVWIALGVAALLVLAHAWASYRHATWIPLPRLDRPVDVPGLVRETVKLIIVVCELGMLMALFTADDLRRPPLWVLIAASAVIGVKIFVARIAWMVAGTLSLVNIDANALAGVLVLAICLLHARRYPTGVALVWAFAVALIMVIAIRKAFLVVCFLILLAVLTQYFDDRHGRTDSARSLKLLGLAAAAAVAGLAIAHIVMSYFFYIEHNPLRVLWGAIITGFEERFDLQRVAFFLAMSAFPFGIGIGQFGAIAERIPEIADYKALFAHNTPLTLFSEMGVVGLALLAGLLYLVWRASLAPHASLRIVILSYFLVPMMANDTHGLRMTVLLLGYFAVVPPQTGKKI